MQSAHESLDRHHVELLVALAHLGHLGRAAASLNVSPSAASHRLKEAERRLGIALTTVEGRSIRLTPAAVHLAEVGDVAQRSMRAAQETACWMASAERAAVRIAFDFYDTAPWFERLPDRPDLPCDVDFVRVGYDDVSDAVVQRRADLGLAPVPRVGGTTDRDIDGGDPQLLCSDELVGVVRSDHRAARRGRLEASDINDETYFTAGDRPVRGFEHHGFFEPAQVFPLRLRKVESLAMILRLVRLHGGVTIQPSLVVRNAPLHELAIVPLADTTIGIHWMFVTDGNPSDDVASVMSTVRSLAH